MKDAIRELAGPAALLAGMLLILAYCKGMNSAWSNDISSRPTPLQPRLSVDASEQARALIKQQWSRVISRCPGLSEFSGDLTPTDSDNQAWGEPNSATVVFKVASEPRSTRLSQWGASGHTCYFGIISGPPATLSIAKPECASLCLARQTKEGGNENFMVQL